MKKEPFLFLSLLSHHLLPKKFLYIQFSQQLKRFLLIMKNGADWKSRKTLSLTHVSTSGPIRVRTKVISKPSKILSRQGNLQINPWWEGVLWARRSSNSFNKALNSNLNRYTMATITAKEKRQSWETVRWIICSNPTVLMKSLQETASCSPTHLGPGLKQSATPSLKVSCSLPSMSHQGSHESHHCDRRRILNRRLRS